MQTQVPGSQIPRAAHPRVPELLGNLELSTQEIEGWTSTPEVEPWLLKAFSNADYWLSFAVAQFEPLLRLSPSPLRELGVAMLLKFGESPDTLLSAEEISRARNALPGQAPETVLQTLQAGLDTLQRAVEARDAIEARRAEGFKLYEFQTSLAVHSLRAGGSASVLIEDATTEEPLTKPALGTVVRLRGTDAKNNPTPAPQIENRLNPPVWVKDSPDKLVRDVWFLVPGKYTLRVPTKSTGAEKLLVR